MQYAMGHKTKERGKSVLDEWLRICLKTVACVCTSFASFRSCPNGFDAIQSRFDGHDKIPSSILASSGGTKNCICAGWKENSN
mmetsp:Transcript_52800/g.61666  ORF Transcript_52800/g.61666 Transcript_52800/m.61666 type:complete len:83 (+) Transcript_52800:1141-1389(+)